MAEDSWQHFGTDADPRYQLVTGRKEHASCVMGDFLYIFGGADGEGNLIEGHLAIERIELRCVLPESSAKNA